MPIRELQYGECSEPHHQYIMRRPKNKPMHDKWIVAVWGKKGFSLAVCEWTGSDLEKWDCEDIAGDYCFLWDALGELNLSKGKWWLIGHGTAYALDMAEFTEALEAGNVLLPTIRSGKNKGKHGGKLTLSRRVVEVDLLCSKNKIKMLDWLNYSVPLDVCLNIKPSSSLAQNCEQLRRFLKAQLIVRNPVVKSTAAQQGWHKARRLKTRRMPWINLDPWCWKLERSAYHAGRNEPFRLGKVPGIAHSLDIKSCYASICLTENLPVRMIEEYRQGLDVDCMEAGGYDHWIAEVIIDTNVPDYPLQWDKTPIYPIGQFRTVLPWPELRHALGYGRVKHVLRAARYESALPMKAYAEWYLQARDDLDGAGMADMIGPLKAMFNASLGFTARQRYDWAEWDTQIGHSYWIGIVASPNDKETPVQAQILGNEKRWLCVHGQARDSIPYLHATICSYARVRLLELFAIAGRQNIIYCDTDGILTNAAGREALENFPSVMGERPGKLVQRFPAGRAEIRGQKVYRIGTNVVHAGMVDTRKSALANDDDVTAIGMDTDIDTTGKRKNTVRVLTCKTGRVSLDGRVEPFRFTCEDTGDMREKWINKMV